VIPRPANPIALALDLSDLDGADALARELAPRVGLLKVGLELVWSSGPDGVRRIAAHGPVFVDAKLHDIPTTVERASWNIARLGPAMFTVHALGGEAMIAAAARGAEGGAREAGVRTPMLVAVTVLSSLSGESLASAATLAFEARAAGAVGAVVSGADVATVREVTGDDFCLIVPGIRPAGSNGHDQVRILTPAEAIEAGADYIVVGRAITRASDPRSAADAILASVR
jgi:orotidine-5'-phosphate decarboxylase